MLGVLGETTTKQQQQQQLKHQKQQLSNIFFSLSLSYDWIVGTLFSQLVFPPKNGHKNGQFSKPHVLQKNSGLKPFKTLFVSRNAFLGVSKFAAISEPFFDPFKNRHPSKTPIFIVFFETHFLHFFQKWPFQNRGFGEVGKMKKIKKEVTNLGKKGNPKTLIWTKIHHKNPQNLYFYSAKMAPKKVDKLITFEVAKLITLERPKVGQTNNSPACAYIYIYICCRVKSWSKIWGFIS